MLVPATLHVGHYVDLGSWHLEPTILGGALIALGLYVFSLNLAGPAPERKRVLLFGLGAGVMLLSLVSPLDAAAHRLLSMHMLQHVALTTVGPPLLLLGLQPASLRFLLRPGRLNQAARLLTSPVLAGTLFILNMWLWHVPPV